jgi:hypothetical protein
MEHPKAVEIISFEGPRDLASVTARPPVGLGTCFLWSGSGRRRRPIRVIQIPLVQFHDRRGFPGRIRGRNRFRPRRRESLEKISESVTKTEICLDKIIPAGMTPTADPVVGRFPEEADMRGKAVL